MSPVDGSLDLVARRSLDRIASAAAALLDVPLVLISVCEAARQIYVGSPKRAYVPIGNRG